MPHKKRLKKNKPYPERWRWKNGSLRYRVPPGQEHQWGGKKEFTLGRTETEAYQTWSKRMAEFDNITLIKELLDRYSHEVIPLKSKKSRESNITSIKRLREVFGHMPVNDLKPKHIFAFRDKATKKRNSPSSVNRDIEVISHGFTKAVEWGLIDSHPLKGNIQKT